MHHRDPIQSGKIKPSFLISLTTIPRRFDGSLPEVLSALKRQSLKCTILVNIPKSYRKWGAVQSIPAALQNIEDVIIYSPKADYGPATKLLGALEYICDKPEITHILTVDDDILIEDAHHLSYLAEFATVLPDFAITFGGIKLDKFPFKRDDGLTYGNRFKFVDVVAGYKGVLYPTRLLRTSKLPFEFSNNLAPGIFNDDDLYFGIVLSVLNIPVFAIPKRPGGSGLKMSNQAGGSAVAEHVDKDRSQNEMEIFQYAVSQGYFLGSKSNANCRIDFWQFIGLMTIYLKNFNRRAIAKMRRLAGIGAGSGRDKHR